MGLQTRVRIEDCLEGPNLGNHETQLQTRKWRRHERKLNSWSSEKGWRDRLVHRAFPPKRQKCFLQRKINHSREHHILEKQYTCATGNFPCVATYPSAGGRRETRGMRIPRKEYARSRHQRLFEENVGKTGKDAIYELLS